jgi:phosphoribosylformylglycinamidine (FGAM) synthase-like enzyme
MLAVAEAARNVACAGAVPIGATNCLNFGSPERPEIMWQFSQVIDGMTAACRALEIPITGGNVSFYNETEGRAVYPTPVIGVVGLLENADRVLSRAFPNAGLDILLLGENFGELGGSEYLKIAHGLIRGVPPHLDLVGERALQHLLASLASESVIRSAHDCSDGGFAIALAECCFDTGGIGAEVDVPRAQVRLKANATDDGRTADERTADGRGRVRLKPDATVNRTTDTAGACTPDAGSVRLPPSHEASADRRSLGGGGQPDLDLAATLFGESASRAIVAVASGRMSDALARAKQAGVPARAIGRTGGPRIRIAVDGTRAIDHALADAEARWTTALERYFAGRAA